MALATRLTVDHKAGKPTFELPVYVRDSFGNLVGEDMQKQATASIVILKHVDTRLQNHNEGELPGDISYIVFRLVSGLMSNRPRAREGFYTTLQALLQLQPSTVPVTFHTVTENWSKNRAFSKYEIKDKILGELLTFGALIRSGQANYHSDMQSKIISRLLQIRKIKSYMDIIATQFLVNLVEKCEGSVTFKNLWNHLEKEISAPVEELNPSSLWLRLVLLRTHKYKPPVWLNSSLDPKNYCAIGQILMETLTALPMVHPLLEEVVIGLAPDDRTTNSHLVKFWCEGLAPCLEHPSTKKLQLLFIVLQLILPKLKKGSEIDAVFPTSMVVLLLTSVSRYDKDLSLSARGLASALLQLVTANQDEDSDVQLTVVKKLIVPPGSVRFDHLTGTKLLTQMKTNYTLTTIKGLAKILIKIIRRQIPKVKPADQTFAAHTLTNLVMHPKVTNADHLTWRAEQLMVLMKMAFFTPGPADLIQDFRDAFFKTLTHLTGHIKEYKIVLLNLVNFADKELQLCETTGTSPLSIEAKNLWSQILGKLLIFEDGDQTSISNQVFQVLYGQMALRLFFEPEGAKDIIDELNACQREVMKKGSAWKKGNASKAEDGLEEPHWVEVVTELLISLLAHEKRIFRSMAQGVFWLMCPEITATALTLITDVLDPSKTSELISKEESDVEDSESDDEKDDDKMEEEDDEELEDKDENEDVDDENIFDIKKKMLSISGNGDVDIDIDDIPEEELNKLDKRLGALFSEYQARRRGKRLGAFDKLAQDEKSLMNFRSRVCDLIDVYIKEACNMGLLMDLVTPLFIALLTADQDHRQRDLQSRLRHCINLLGKIQKFTSVGDATVDTLIETFNNFFNNAYEIPESYSPLVQECYIFLFRCGRQLLEEEFHKPNNPLTQAYISHLESYFAEKSCSLKLEAFLDPCSSNIGGLWTIAEFAVKCGFDPGVKVFRQMQALGVLKKLYTNKALLTQGNKEDITRIEGELSKKTVDALNSFQTPESINGAYMASLFAVLVIIHKNHAQKGSPNNFNWDEIKVAVIGVRQRISGKSLNAFRKPYNALQQALRLPKVVYGVKNLQSKNTDTATIKASQEECINEGEAVKDSKRKKKREKRAKKAQNVEEEDGNTIEKATEEKVEEATVEASIEEENGKQKKKRKQSTSSHQKQKKKKRSE
ncbi:myb-binding protein 1A-like protein [Homarus americanus]|uniref:myb-binding protein 1A-like protein n=1 Tax=Homarus americanus TaxID=6706 RepID=UPI001C44B431|nr:myb-binding protein 1A-like protein [Homarus americanus]